MSERESFPGDILAAYNDGGNGIVIAKVETRVAKSDDGEGGIVRSNETVVVLALRRAEKSAPKQFTTTQLLSRLFGNKFAEQATRIGRKNDHFDFVAVSVPEGWTADAYAKEIVVYAAKAVGNIQINSNNAHRVVLPFGMSLNAIPVGTRKGPLFGAVTFSSANCDLTVNVNLMRRAFNGTAMKRAREMLSNNYGFVEDASSGEWVTFKKVEPHTPSEYAPAPNSGVEPTTNYVYRGYAQPLRCTLLDLVPARSIPARARKSRPSKK